MLHIYVLRLNNGFLTLSDANLVAKAMNIHSRMSANSSVFVSPDPTLAVLLDAIQEFQAGMQAASTGDRDAAARKNQLKLELVSILHNLGAYVLYIAKGDRDIASLSGFTVAKEATAVVLVKPQDLVATATNQRGKLFVSVKHQRGSGSYLYEYTTDAEQKEGSWTPKSCTKSECILGGLTSGSTYFIRVSVVGGNDQLITSDVISCVAP